MADKLEQDVGRSPSGRAATPSGLSRASASSCQHGIPNAERIAALESIIRDTLWMACRYAHGRQSYAVGMYNDAARRAVALGAVKQDLETFAVDGSLSAAMSGLSVQEFAMAMHNWSDPSTIRTHVPKRPYPNAGGDQ